MIFFDVLIIYTYSTVKNKRLIRNGEESNK